MSEEPQVYVEVRKLYVNDLSLEVPHAPHIFREEQEHPEIALNLAHEVIKLPEEKYHAVHLKLTVTAKEKDKTIYLVEVSQGGVFEISGLTDEQQHHALNSYCLTILFPFAREVISNAIVKAGFPALYLAPVNFDAIYQERMQSANNNDGAGQQ